MTSLIKALPLGGILTFILSEAIWAAKYKGGYLNIAAVDLSGHSIHWSWPLFVIAAGGITGLLLLMK